MSAPTDNQKGNWVWGNGVLGYTKDANKVDEVAEGKVACTDDIFKNAFANTKELYDKEYMYPGAGRCNAYDRRRTRCVLSGQKRLFVRKLQQASAR